MIMCWQYFKQLYLCQQSYTVSFIIVCFFQHYHIFIILNLIFTIYKLRCSNTYCMPLKMEVKKYLNLTLILDLDNYRHSLQRWFEIRKHYQPVQTKILPDVFDYYLPIVKPVIHNFSQILKKVNPQNYGFYTNLLTEQQIQRIKQLFEPLKKYDIRQEAKVQQAAKQQQSKKFISPPEKELYRMEIGSYPTNQQIEWWGNTLEVDPIIIKGIVIKGKGIGAKDLGMPTANLQMTPEINKQLIQYPNGIYLTEFQLSDKKYIAVTSIGTNPHYENLKESRVIESYVLHNFGEETFYEVVVTLKLLRIIRLQGKFPTFDSFLNAMHNDIYIGLKWGA